MIKNFTRGCWTHPLVFIKYKNVYAESSLFTHLHKQVVLALLQPIKKTGVKPVFFNLGRSGLSCSLAFNGNSAFCFQKLRFFQTKTLQPQLVRSRTSTEVLVIKTTIKKEVQWPLFLWWALEDSNFWPSPCKGDALPTELNALALRHIYTISNIFCCQYKFLMTWNKSR